MPVPFGRVGGKSRIAKQIISVFPDNYKVYVEPFFGAGGIFFRIPESKKAKLNIINDIDQDIYIVMKELQNNSEYINNNVTRTHITKEQWITLLNKNDAVSIIEKIRYSFFSRGVSYNPSKIKYNDQLIKTDFTKFQNKLTNTIILNHDYKKIILDFDSQESFFYLDPPYEHTNKSYYNDFFVDPLEVYHILKNIKGKFILSYNNSQNIQDIFSIFNIYIIKTKYINTSTLAIKDKSELLITNLNLNDSPYLLKI